MYLSTAPSLLLGLGARIVAEWFLRSPDIDPTVPRIGHTLLVGLWQGIALYYSFMEYSEAAIVVGVGAAAYQVFDYMVSNDAMKGASMLIGTALGVCCTDILSQFLDDGVFKALHIGYVPPPAVESSTATAYRRERLVQFRRSVDGESRSSRRRIPDTTNSTSTTATAPSMTSSTDTLDPDGTMTPAEREVAALRMRASLADTERRRYREEKKWALSQGNRARASQLSWQVKRYTALMQSFHREADARVIEASNRARDARTSPERVPSHPPPEPSRRQSISVDVGGRQRKPSSGNVRAPVHVQVRWVVATCDYGHSTSQLEKSSRAFPKTQFILLHHTNNAWDPQYPRGSHSGCRAHSCQLPRLTVSGVDVRERGTAPHDGGSDMGNHHLMHRVMDVWGTSYSMRAVVGCTYSGRVHRTMGGRVTHSTRRANAQDECGRLREGVESIKRAWKKK
ncbi:hypothetical protein PLICRDRAFT_27766 [Plicaturopsis crispa FD-325 SS-3]|nr:hypothetical protein PLICRDRAFT_27766 [Plicaturopsis crispa FD-325 SS-3]